MNVNFEKIVEFLFLFVLFSIAGWVVEFVYRSVRDRRVVNPGFLKGPYLILYGSSAVILAMSFEFLLTIPLHFRLILYFFFLTLFEFAAGMVAERVYSIKLWDYSDLKFHYRGKISLWYSLCWVLMAFLFEKFLYLHFVQFSLEVPVAARAVSAFSILSIMTIDYVYHYHVRKAHRPDQSLQELEEEFRLIASEIFYHKDVGRLNDYFHHRSKTRLNHVLEVSWFSFLIAKRFSCDVHSTVRGALLHDFFHYDWLYEGPRLHGFRHPSIALRNASEVFSLNAIEKDIIKKHMWPLTVVPPLYKESMIVCIVDTVCATMDYLHLPLPEPRSVRIYLDVK